MLDRSQSLVALLRSRAVETPDRGYTWLAQGEEAVDRLTYAGLDARASAIAAALANAAPPGGGGGGPPPRWRPGRPRQRHSRGIGQRGPPGGAGAPAASPRARVRGGVLRRPSPRGGAGRRRTGRA